MIKLYCFTDCGFKITWTLIDIGFKGSKQFYNQLVAEDIINYAYLQLVEELNQPDEIILLAGEKKENEEEVSNLVKILSEKEDCNRNIEYRKWRLLYVKTHLINKNDDFIQGLIELGNIWSYFDFPNDSPHIFQGKNNTMHPKEYYTKENYHDLFLRHEEWIKREIQIILDEQ